MIAGLHAVGAKVTGDLLEVGSGWTPITPLMFFIAGMDHVTLTDIERFYDKSSIPTAVAFARTRLYALAERLSMAEAAINTRVDEFRPEYLCPWKPSLHPDQSVDIAVTRAVLEHVPGRDIEELFLQLRRIVRPGGYMCHSIDNTDHWQHDQSGSNLVDFLRYPSDSLRWRLASFNGYTNRLRHSDYLAYAQKAGWTIALERSHVPEKTLADAQQMKNNGQLAPEFTDRDLRDLAATSTLIVARRDA